MSSSEASKGASSKLTSVSNFILQVESYLPFVAVAAFAFDKETSRLMYAFGFDETIISHFSVLRTQHDFLISKNLTHHLHFYDLHIFELFIWVAPVIGLLRVLTGLCSMEVLDSFRKKLDNLKKKGFSTRGLLVSFLFGGPFVIFCSLNFAFASSSDLALFLMTKSPGAFIGLSAFLFCGGVMFSAEGVLFLAWLIFRLKRTGT